MATETAVVTADYIEYTNAQRWVIMAAVMLGALMTVIDTSIVNVAVPSMMGNLGATLTQIGWVSTGYIVANVIMLPLTGWFSSRFGRKNYLAASMVLFTLASLFCGTSHTLVELIIFRVLQGIGGAALLSTSQSTLMEIFPPQMLGMAQAIYGVCIMVGPTIGPTLGGWLTDNYSWPMIFFINIPIGILATILTLIFVHDSKYKRASSQVDFIGIAFLAIGLGCLQTFLEKGNDDGWFESNFICMIGAIALAGIIAFIIWELRTEHPAVNLRILHNRGFSAGTLFGTILGVGLYGGMFILPVYLQQLRGFTAQQSGVIMIPGAIATALVMPIVGKLSGRFAARSLVAIGAVAFVVSMIMMRTITIDSSPMDLFWPLVIRGASMGFLFVPLTLATLSGLKGHDIAEGTGLFNLSRQLGGSVGIAILTTFIDHRSVFHRAMLSEHINLYNPLANLRYETYIQFFIMKGSALLVAQKQAIAALSGTVQQQAAMMSFIDAFLFIGGVFLIAIPLLLLFEKTTHGAKADISVSAE